jgi:hypothetical protein
MRDSDAQKSEVHETTDDASTSPASNARQNPGEDAREATRDDAVASNFERGAADRDIDLTADMSEDHTIYPTSAPPPEQREQKNPDHDRKKVFPGEAPEDNVVDRTTENLSP